MPTISVSKRALRIKVHCNPPFARRAYLCRFWFPRPPEGTGRYATCRSPRYHARPDLGGPLWCRREPARERPNPAGLRLIPCWTLTERPSPGRELGGANTVSWGDVVDLATTAHQGRGLSRRCSLCPSRLSAFGLWLTRIFIDLSAAAPHSDSHRAIAPRNPRDEYSAFPVRGFVRHCRAEGAAKGEKSNLS